MGVTKLRWSMQKLICSFKVNTLTQWMFLVYVNARDLFLGQQIHCFTGFFFNFLVVKSEISFEVMTFYFASGCCTKLGCIPAFYREVYEKICSPTSGNVEREVFKSLLVKSQLSSSVLSQVCLLVSLLSSFIFYRSSVVA